MILNKPDNTGNYRTTAKSTGYLSDRPLYSKFSASDFLTLTALHHKPGN